ncbi:hypothetical protein [Haloarcula sp. JP-L23]|uniref:hypothetical protein n=1 Tax=Haloarcula sp. JP-L23 TaxID=2716717 RepID=UPI00140F28D7|nr:hypothetical protein G9465_14890 [Haloarcula sp. JP-L23]
MSSATELADPKAIGLDVEDLVVGAVDALAAAEDDDAHHDAVVTELLCPSVPASRSRRRSAGPATALAGRVVGGC